MSIDGLLPHRPGTRLDLCVRALLASLAVATSALAVEGARTTITLKESTTAGIDSRERGRRFSPSTPGDAVHRALPPRLPPPRAETTAALIAGSKIEPAANAFDN